jgi:tetratricopeptide (TPR) repeat protein
LEINQGKPLLLNGFISTTTHDYVASNFINQNLEGFSKVILEFENLNNELINFASIKDYSDHSEEDEHLININNFFKVKKITKNVANNYHHIILEQFDINEIKKNLSNTTLEYQQELKIKMLKNYDIDCLYLADLLIELQRGTELIPLLESIKEEISYNNNILCKINNLLGGSYECIGQYDKAIEIYKEAVQEGLKAIGENHPDIANIYSNIVCSLNKKENMINLLNG